MELGKYKKAMRPKKYLTHEFLVYRPSTLEARSEMQAGGVVQREMHATDPFVGKQTKPSTVVRKKISNTEAKKIKKTLPSGVSLSKRPGGGYTLEGLIKRKGKTIE